VLIFSGEIISFYYGFKDGFISCPIRVNIENKKIFKLTDKSCEKLVVAENEFEAYVWMEILQFSNDATVEEVGNVDFFV
jgi:hypothetical protein